MDDTTKHSPVPAKQSTPDAFISDYLYRLDQERLAEEGVITDVYPQSTIRTVNNGRESASESLPNAHMNFNPVTGVCMIVKENHDPQLLAGARWMSPNEFMLVQRQRLYQWQPQQEVWPLVHGNKIAAALGLFGGAILNIHVRYFFHLVAQRMMTTMVASAGVASLWNYFAYHNLIKEPAIQGLTYAKGDECPLCLTVKGAVIQTVTGTVFPFIFATVGSMGVAKMERTYPVPPLNDVRKLANMTKLCFQSMRTPFIGLAIVQAVMGSWLSYNTAKSMWIVRSKDTNNLDNFMINRNNAVAAPPVNIPPVVVRARCGGPAMRVRLEMAVEMHCASCEMSVRECLQKAGVEVESVDVHLERVVCHTDRPAHEVLALLHASGKKAVLRGAGSAASRMQELDFGAGACILHPASGPVENGDASSLSVQGVVRLFQLTDEVCRVEGALRLHGVRNQIVIVAIHQLGDLSQGCTSCGPIINSDESHVVTMEQSDGYVGSTRVDAEGNASFVFEVTRVKLWDLIGRSIVIHTTQSDQSGVACGIIARSAGLFTNTKKVCACDGTTLWQEKVSNP